MPGSTIHKNTITYPKHVAFGQMKVFRVYSLGVNQRTLPFVFESNDTIFKILKKINKSKLIHRNVMIQLNGLILEIPTESSLGECNHHKEYDRNS